MSLWETEREREIRVLIEDGRVAWWHRHTGLSIYCIYPSISICLLNNEWRWKRETTVCCWFSHRRRFAHSPQRPSFVSLAGFVFSFFLFLLLLLLLFVFFFFRHHQKTLSSFKKYTGKVNSLHTDWPIWQQPRRNSLLVCRALIWSSPTNTLCSLYCPQTHTKKKKMRVCFFGRSFNLTIPWYYLLFERSAGGRHR